MVTFLCRKINLFTDASCLSKICYYASFHWLFHRVLVTTMLVLLLAATMKHVFRNISSHILTRFESVIFLRNYLLVLKNLRLLYDTHPFYSVTYLCLHLFTFRFHKAFSASSTISIFTISLFLYLLAYVQKLS